MKTTQACANRECGVYKLLQKENFILGITLLCKWTTVLSWNTNEVIQEREETCSMTLLAVFKLRAVCTFKPEPN